MPPKTGKEAMLAWCKACCKDFGVSVDNFNMSWKDGLAFCALYAHYRSDLLDFSRCKKDTPKANLVYAFSVGEQLGVTSLLDPEDILDLPTPDQFSIMTYLSQCYHQLVNAGRGGGIASIKFGGTPTSQPQAAPTPVAAPGRPALSVTCSECNKTYPEKGLKVSGRLYCNKCGRQAYLNLVASNRNAPRPNPLNSTSSTINQDKEKERKEKEEKERKEKEEKERKEKEEKERKEKEENERKEKEERERKIREERERKEKEERERKEREERERKERERKEREERERKERERKEREERERKEREEKERKEKEKREREERERKEKEKREREERGRKEKEEREREERERKEKEEKERMKQEEEFQKKKEEIIRAKELQATHEEKLRQERELQKLIDEQERKKQEQERERERERIEREKEQERKRREREEKERKEKEEKERKEKEEKERREREEKERREREEKEKREREEKEKREREEKERSEREVKERREREEKERRERERILIEEKEREREKERREREKEREREQEKREREEKEEKEKERERERERVLREEKKREERLQREKELQAIRDEKLRLERELQELRENRSRKEKEEQERRMKEQQSRNERMKMEMESSNKSEPIKTRAFVRARTNAFLSREEEEVEEKIEQNKEPAKLQRLNTHLQKQVVETSFSAEDAERQLDELLQAGYSGDLAEAPQIPNPQFYEGTLLMLKKNGKKTYKWFSLQDTRLVYYKKEQQKETLAVESLPKGIIDLAFFTFSIHGLDIKLESKERTYVLTCNSLEDLKNWSEKIQISSNRVSILRSIAQQEEKNNQRTSFFNVFENKSDFIEMQEKTLFGKRWRRVYLVMRGGIISFYDCPGGKSLGKQPLYECEMGEYQPEQLSRCWFVTTTHPETHKKITNIFTAPTEMDMQGWVKAMLIQKLIIEDAIMNMTLNTEIYSH